MNNKPSAFSSDSQNQLNGELQNSQLETEYKDTKKSPQTAKNKTGKTDAFLTKLEALAAGSTPPPVNLAAILQGLKINPNDELRPPEKAWVQIKDGEETILGTLGNYSLLIGKAKSRKSFFINIIVSVILLRHRIVFNQFKSLLPDNKVKTLYFDTEQGGYHVQLALKRICKQIDEPEPEHLEVYKLRSKAPSERLELIEYAIYNTPNLGFVVIDGIKDLVNSINDENEATMIASKLLKWTEELNIHIVVVLHQNKNDTNARGHLGTELVNKAETVLSVTKNPENKDISVVDSQDSRNIDLSPFAFEIIDNLPQIIEDFEIRTAPNKNKVEFEHLSGLDQYALVEAAYSVDSSFNYAELVRQLKLAFKDRYKKTIGDNRIKELITYCKSKKWLIQEKPKAPYKKGKFSREVDSMLE
jgi:hypothetical protein